MTLRARRALAAIAFTLLGGCRTSHPPAPAPAPAPPAPPLAFNELLRDEGGKLAPSAKALSLAGKRVHMTGFMVEMEIPPRGGFFLAARPLHCDEAGGGTADLPLESVLVLTESAQGRAIPWIEGALDVSGVLEVGNQPG